jgi:hypothetical protein
VVSNNRGAELESQKTSDAFTQQRSFLMRLGALLGAINGKEDHWLYQAADPCR